MEIARKDMTTSSGGFALNPPARFSAQSRVVQAFVSALALAAVGVLLAHAPLVSLTHPTVFVLLAVAAFLSGRFALQGPGDACCRMVLSVAHAGVFAAMLLLGPDAAMFVAAAAAAGEAALTSAPQRPWYYLLFRLSALVVTVQAAGLAYLALGGVHATEVGSLAGLERPVVGAALAYFGMDTLLTAGALVASGRSYVLKLWHDHLLWSALHDVVAICCATAGVFVVRDAGYWLMPMVLAPLYLTWRTYRAHLDRVQGDERHVQELGDLHLATIEALALAIDAKDQAATSHIRRVQVYAAGLARHLGMSDMDIQGVKTAALLHDIGKLAVPEHILSKPGPLTQEEFQKIKVHPQIGAEIIGTVPFPYPVAPLILSHHERWDGRGYPAGLKGEHIPLGARILAVVDHFDALTSDRPYRRTMSAEAAMAVIAQESGKALDPRIVALFRELWPALDAEANAQHAPVRRLSFIVPAGPESARPAAGLATEPPSKTVFQHIALAHREISALYEIAQSMGTSLGVQDTMALISSKLSKLVPVSCSALFLYHEDADTMTCRFADGTDAHLVQELALSNGQGLAGWVGRNERPLVNAPPSADFEAAGLKVSTQLHSALVCPLVFNEHLIGALAVYHVDSGRYTDDHRRLLDRVAEQAAAVVNNSILFEQTKHDSLTDPLTGLPNTRFLFVHLTRELARAERLRQQVSLLVMDLDGFKEINDMHGHHAGDRALREVARVLRNGIRPYDICVRYAGDEFVVVLSGCGAEEAEVKKLELQKAIEEIPFETWPGMFTKLGASAGGAVFPEDGEAYETLLATADKRMYKDKAARKRSPDAAPSNDSGQVAAATAEPRQGFGAS
jgi:diguanylate cyclase (GGDEF)-like protein/putative nucleotidyltransferase with HDIG domain